MDLLKEKYIILELIPTSLNPDKGLIVQISALKLDGLLLLDRFDYRLNEKYIPYDSMKEMFSYDKDNFTYRDTKEELLKEFQSWTDNLPILIIDDKYTANYLNDFSNSLFQITAFLNIPYSDDLIEKLISKYQLEPSNYIVDLLYEALIKEL